MIAIAEIIGYNIDMTTGKSVVESYLKRKYNI